MSTYEFTGWNALAAQLLPPTTSGTPSTYPGPTGESTLADSKSVDLSGKTIYSIDASDVGATDDPGVADSGRTDGGDGLYVFDGNDTDGWTAYKVDGNAHEQGWNVVAKVDDAFALEATFNSEADTGTLGSRIVDFSGNTATDATAITGTAVGASASANVSGFLPLVVGTDSKVDAFEVTGGNGAPFALGDMKYDNLFDTESAATTVLAAAAGGSGDIDYVGYLEDASSDSLCWWCG